MVRDMSAGVGRTALRLLIVILLVLVASEYMFGWILGGTNIRRFIYGPIYNDSVYKYSVSQQMNLTTTQSSQSNQTDIALPDNLCDETPPGLGPVTVNKTEVPLASIEDKYPEIRLGGRYTPPNCTARHKVAIIVPYKDREQHLAIFLNHMHPFLMKQQIAYGIYIIEQAGKKDFNRAKLMNVGFEASQKFEQGGYQCFIFHDIDLLPQDTRNMYTCPKQPRHMSVAVDKFKYRLPYKNIFGGVSALTLEQFTKVNGFSNRYWGWGGEDDDMFKRLSEMKYEISRYDIGIAKYMMLQHKQAAKNPKRTQYLKETPKTFRHDGLSSLKYDFIKMNRYHLYTHVLADIDDDS